MTELSYPFPPAITGDLTDPGVVATADKWRRQAKWWVRSGVHVDDLSDTAGAFYTTSATDTLAVDLGSGKASVEGFYYENTATIRFPVNPAHPTLARWDRIVARLVLDPVTGSGRVRAVYVPGNPGDAQARPLTQTVTTWEINLARFRVGPAAGRADAPLNTLWSNSSRGEVGWRFSSALPDRQDAGYQWRPGERCTLYDPVLGGDVDYVYDGLNWCVVPGQLLYAAAFTDSQAFDYSQGFYRIGQRGGVDANFSFLVPRVLQGHGLRVRWHAWPGTGNLRRGDVITTTIYNYTSGVGPIGVGERTVVNADAATAFANGTINGETTFTSDDIALGTPGQVTNFCIAAVLGHGTVQFIDGRCTVESV